MTNTLTNNELAFLISMDQLAMWYAGHKIPGAHYVYSLPEEASDSYDGRIISLTYRVNDRHDLEVGHVSWAIDAPGDGWSYTITF